MKRTVRPAGIVCWLAVVLLAGFSLSASAGSLRLPHVIADHMVLQQGQPVALWGWADPGTEVAAAFAGQRKTARAGADGRWRLILDPLTASAEPRVLTITAGEETLAVQDVLVGEVWLCSGQSNMQWAVRQADDADKEIAAADWPLIRHFGVPRRFAPEARDDVDAAWAVCSPSTVAEFTAVGYFFGRTLHQELKVPIGLLNASWGGTRIEPWIAPEGYAAEPALKALYERVQLADPGSALHKNVVGTYLDQVAAWLAGARKQQAEGGWITAPPAYPDTLKPIAMHQETCALYYGMVNGLVPYGMRGAIWYQGESNREDGAIYTDKMKALIGGWRTVWKARGAATGDFPFYYVQIAPYQYGEEDPGQLPVFWEAQRAALAVPNTGMIVVHDIGNLKDIHPRNKQEAGRRLALWALARDYGRDGLVHSGPLFKALAIEGDRIRVRFDHAGSGLATRDGQAPNLFEVIGEDTYFEKADAVIEGDSVVVRSPAVARPVAVRMGWHKLAEPNLVNKESLPAAPFSAGDIPARDWLKLKVPESKEYQVLYDLDLKNLGREVRYGVDRRADLAGPIERVAYFLELQKPNQATEYVYVSMAAFTQDPGKLGIPTVSSGARFAQPVKDLRVISNVAGVKTGTIAQGNLEFWSNNYGQRNTANVPGADSGTYDIGDEPVEPVDGYGSMQVHNTAAKQTILAVNHWRDGDKADLGIGNSPGNSRDWTFTGNAGQFAVRRLRVLVKTKGE